MGTWQIKLILNDYKAPWVGMHQGRRVAAMGLAKEMNRKLFGGRATVIVKRVRKVK